MGSNARLMHGSSARKEGASDRYYSDNGVDKLRKACGLGDIKPGKVSCLRCQEDFDSPDKTRIRICFACKKGKVWVGSRDSDSIYPSISPVTEFKKGVGQQRQSQLFRQRTATKARARTKHQKQFGSKPLSKKRTSE